MFHCHPQIHHPKTKPNENLWKWNKLNVIYQWQPRGIKWTIWKSTWEFTLWVNSMWNEKKTAHTHTEWERGHIQIPFKLKHKNKSLNKCKFVCCRSKTNDHFLSYFSFPYIHRLLLTNWIICIRFRCEPEIAFLENVRSF